jgi:protein-disulfide isomerase
MIRTFLPRLVVVCSALCSVSFAQAPSSDKVLVEIDGTKLTSGDMEREHPSLFFHARNTFFEGQKKAILAFVDDYLLNRQAQKEHVTVDQLLDRHVNNVVAKDPPEDALRVYYEGVDTTEPYEAVRGQILAHIREVRLAKAKTSYLQSLRSEAKVELRLAPPRAEVATKAIPVRGASNALVTIAEYADYECPYCQQAEPTLLKLLADYDGRVAFSYNDVPLPMHTHAQKASEAAHCADDQGKFWEYHDLLYASRQLEIPQLKAAARELKLNGEVFDQCLDSGQKAESVKSQLSEGQALGLEGTPSFFINGRFVSGNVSYGDWRRIIDEEIAVSSPRAGQTPGVASGDGGTTTNR